MSADNTMQPIKDFPTSHGSLSRGRTEEMFLDAPARGLASRGLPGLSSIVFEIGFGTVQTGGDYRD